MYGIGDGIGNMMRDMLIAIIGLLVIIAGLVGWIILS